MVTKTSDFAVTTIFELEAITCRGLVEAISCQGGKSLLQVTPWL
jgi:hypothetical protein